MKQRSPEWFAARRNMVTASMVPEILELDGLSRSEALREMVADTLGYEPAFKGNIATRWGEAHEVDGRQTLELERGIIVEEVGFIVHPTYRWLGASPDGLAGKLSCEIKCPFSRKIPDSPKESHFAQVQTQLECADRDAALLIYWSPERHRIFDVARNREWWAESLPKLKAFYDEAQDVLRGIEAGEIDREAFLFGGEVPVMHDDDWNAAEASYLAARSMRMQGEAEEKKWRAELERMSANRTCRGNVVKVIWYDRAGSIDYSKALKEFGIEADRLETFRKKAARVCRVDVGESDE